MIGIRLGCELMKVGGDEAGINFWGIALQKSGRIELCSYQLKVFANIFSQVTLAWKRENTFVFLRELKAALDLYSVGVI